MRSCVNREWIGDNKGSRLISYFFDCRYDTEIPGVVRVPCGDTNFFDFQFDPERRFVDRWVSFPGGRMWEDVTVYVLKNLFWRISVFHKEQPAPRCNWELELRFYPKDDAPRYWKDAMVQIIKEVGEIDGVHRRLSEEMFVEAVARD